MCIRDRVWEKLEMELAKYGLALRLYPTSAPASTVGGWLAQGGAGIGSFEAGWFRDNVVSARVAMPDGSVKDFRGQDLELISEAEGTTGLISEVTVRVQVLEEMEVASVGCGNPHSLQRLVQAIIDERLPVWSLVFINPRMAEFKNKVTTVEAHGHGSQEKQLLPAVYIMTLAYRKKDRDAVMGRLSELAKVNGAEMLSESIARQEWGERFKIMVVKRLGPSLVPAEVVVPLSSLGAVMDEITKKVAQPIVKEAIVIREGSAGKPEVVLLGFIPSDQREFSYNFVFSLALTISDIAERNGGREYATGLYFAGKADRVLGPERLKRLRAFKASVDPRGILNPGKVMENGAVGGVLDIAQALEPVVRALANRVVPKVGERPTRPVRGIPADVAWYAYACSQCG
ncbi:MAG: FAD-binding oxidoreductase, partial [Dehalococcoidia bacterium]|nr:FAD-binding oxidoreductase [Dehalococcoidia bacterium]